MDIDPQHVIASKFVAGAAGAAAGLYAFPGTTWLQKVARFFGALLCAIFIGPLLVSAMNITDENVKAGIIFCTGAAGLVLLMGIIEGVKQTTFGTFIQGWLTAFKPKGGDQP